MMRLIKNSEPVFHLHKCSENRKGKEMTAQELHDFAVEALMEEYAMTKAEVMKYVKQTDNVADFYFINTGIRPNFSTGKYGSKKVNIIVVYQDEINPDLSEVDTSWLIEQYNRNSEIPRVIFASAWCVDGKDSGKPAICGSSFCFKYYPVSVIPDQVNAELPDRLSDIQLAAKYAEAWNRLDASILEPYLDKDFHYASDWVFDQMPCRYEFMDYFIKKLETFSRDGVQPKAYVGRDRKTGDVAVLLQFKELDALTITTNNGRITSARMQEYDSRFEPFDPSDELYMNHGDHLECIMPAQKLLIDHLQDIIKESKLWNKAYTEVSMDELYKTKTDVFSLMYGDGEIRIFKLLAYNEANNTNEIVSLFPVCTGSPVEVKIERVIEWDNQLEATVYCSIDDWEFAFFAIDYYCNKDKYKVGERLSIDLSAMAMSAAEGQRELKLEGEHAVNWHTRLGEQPTYREDGTPEPVVFNMENLVAYINKDSKCPDEAEFQSPVGPIESTSILGVDFYKTRIIVRRFESDDKETETIVPLYFRQEFYKDIREGDPLHGMLWMIGQITGQHEENQHKPAKRNTLADMGRRFAKFMGQSKFTSFDNLMWILHQLPLLKIHNGYELDAFQLGDELNWVIQPYCCKTGATKRYAYSWHRKYKDSLRIHGCIGYKEAKSVPYHLEYFDAPFTEEGIMQAWLLHCLTDFMPKAWHANYSKKSFIFGAESIKDLFTPKGDQNNSIQDIFLRQRQKVVHQVLAIDIDSLLPSVDIDGDQAQLRYAYWNDWQGLVKVMVDIKRHGNSIRFDEPQCTTIIKFECGIRF